MAGNGAKVGATTNMRLDKESRSTKNGLLTELTEQDHRRVGYLQSRMARVELAAGINHSLQGAGQG